MRASNLTYLDGKKEIAAGSSVKFIDEHYLDVYQIKLVAGRTLTISDSNKTTLIKIALAKALDSAIRQHQ